MLSKSTRSQIFQTVNYSLFGPVLNEKTVMYGSPRAIPVLSFEQLYQKAVQKFKKLDIELKRVPSWRSNCVIRVYRHSSLKYEGRLYWMYGIEVYLRHFFKMKCHQQMAIDYSSYQINSWFCQDDYALFEPDFVDYFVRLH